MQTSILSDAIVREIKVNIPDVATKQLQIQDTAGRRRVTLSSNWLMMMGFMGPETPVIEESLGKNNGIRVRLASAEEIAAGKGKKVYTRFYNSRSANPLNPVARRKERLIQIAGQKIINESLGDCTHVHITLTYGVIIFSPVKAEQFELIQDLDGEEKINTLVAMTGGVDCHILENSGFRVDTVIEYRPQEKRDKTDFTELTSLSVLANSAPRVLINEDIYSLNPTRLALLIGNTPITVAHFSLQCDDFSLLKTNKQKSDSVVDMSSTLDMFIPMLAVLDAVKPPVLIIENVPGFLHSPISDVVKLQLQRRGYNVNQQILDAREHAGYTSRKRLYLVATTLDNPFNFPKPMSLPIDVWKEVIEPNWEEIQTREVTNNKVVSDSITSGRARVITMDKPYAPTLTKAQGQDTKDAVVVYHENRFYRLPIKVQKMLNCIDEGFNTDWMPTDKAAQIIGQSICGNMHHALMTEVKNHIKQASSVH